MQPLLSIEQLSVRLPERADRQYALHDVSLTVAPNEILCVVGESGSGKSMTAAAIMGLLPSGVQAAAGSISFEGSDLLKLSGHEMRRIRGARIGMIFQEPMTALNPLQTIGDQIIEMFRTHTTLSRRDIRARVLNLLTEVNIRDPLGAMKAFPHELSGGQRQRAMIAMALSLEPRLLIADEPTTALDVTTQAQILRLIRDMQRRTGTAVLFITHDFGVVADIADRVAVMRGGAIVEQGPANAVLKRPQAAYTKSLIAAVPSLTPKAKPPSGGAPVLEIANLTKIYRSGGLLRSLRREHRALDSVTLTLTQGTTLGIVGESGSGKSTLARCIVRLLEADGGTIRLEGADPSDISSGGLHAYRRKVQMVFQDPFASLNPRRHVGEIIAQGPILHGISRREALGRAVELLSVVGLDASAFERYPHQFSGGQRQRIGLARALALEPSVLVADEPVSALDVSVQAQVLQLLAELRTKLGLSILFITHDLRVAAQICDRVVVMKDGAVVEEGVTTQIFASPRHPYTQALMASIPGASWFGSVASDLTPTSSNHIVDIV
jgi:peptide/nickel transport system ATP-binding protein